MKLSLSGNCHSLLQPGWRNPFHPGFTSASVFFVLIIFVSGCGEASRTDSPADSTGAAISALEKNVSDYPDSTVFRTKLADAYENAGKAEKAIDMYDSLLATDSLNTLWYNRKASAYLSLGDTASTLSTLRSSLDVEPTQGDILLEMGFLYADMKNDSALLIADLLRRPGSDPILITNSFYLKGVYYSNTGETEKALAAFDECILHDYTFIDAHLEKGILLYNKLRYPEALTVFDKARAISNTNADAYFWTGKTYEAMNRKAEAIDFYKKALGLDDRLAEATERLKKLEQN